MKTLKPLSNFTGTRPVITIVMDGVGLAPESEANAVRLARTPNLDRLMATCPWVQLKAHGTAVGLPTDDDMGNSEVGHNALGSGQVFAQGAKLVSASIESGKMFASKAWEELTGGVKQSGGTLHFIGLFSDGNVHSHIDHLKAMIERAKKDGVAKVRVHILLDGRDVGETSALDYVDPFEDFLAGLRDDSFDVKIASGGGRMKITMDRYEANWAMVDLGWKTHVLGEGRQFASAHDAIVTLREETHAIDQDLDPFVIAADGRPVGTIEDGDSVIFYNFRGDRAIEISKAFEGGADFDKFDRVRVPKIVYSGMLEYDGDTHVPSRYLVAPPEITNTMGEYLADMKIRQFAISETQKYGHVTYFWNGNRSGKFSEEYETYEEIPLADKPLLFSYIGRMQEEVHRFAIEYHRKVRSSSTRTSLLDEIPGIGLKRRNALLRTFKSIEKIRQIALAEDGEETLTGAESMDRRAAAAVCGFFREAAGSAGAQQTTEGAGAQEEAGSAEAQRDKNDVHREEEK